MESLKNTINLTEIRYPVFKLPKSASPIVEGPLTFVYSAQYDEEAEEYYDNIRIVDDKRIPGDSLSRRRLILLDSGKILQKISKAIFFLGDLVKSADRNDHFIDSNGRLFQYKKTTRAKLTFHKVTNVIPIPTGGALLDIKDIPSRMKVLFAPEKQDIYAGILHMGLANILYGIYEQPYKSSWRMV